MSALVIVPGSGLPMSTTSISDFSDITCHDRMVTLVTQMLDLNKKLQDARLEQERTMLSRQIEATDGAIDKLVYELYGLTGGDCDCGGGWEMKQQEKIAIQIKSGEIVNTPIVIDCMTI